MIRTEREYKLAIQDYTDARQRIDRLRASLQQQGYDASTIADLLDSEVSFNAQLGDEIDLYERARKRQFEATPLQSIGLLLIQLRIANDLTQRELAERLGVHESVVSRDERNAYHGVTIERATKVLAAMGERLDLVVAARPAQTVTSTAGAFDWGVSLNTFTMAQNGANNLPGNALIIDAHYPGPYAAIMPGNKTDDKSMLTSSEHQQQELVGR